MITIKNCQRPISVFSLINCSKCWLERGTFSKKMLAWSSVKCYWRSGTAHWWLYSDRPGDLEAWDLRTAFSRCWRMGYWERYKDGTVRGEMILCVLFALGFVNFYDPQRPTEGSIWSDRKRRAVYRERSQNSQSIPRSRACYFTIFPVCMITNEVPEWREVPLESPNFLAALCFKCLKLKYF